MEPMPQQRAGMRSDIDRDEDAEAAYQEHLSRSEHVWNRWSSWYGMSESDFEPMRNEAMTLLELESGDQVLDVGCGPGVNFAQLREFVGDSGAIHAIDYSPEMVSKARERIDSRGWENVHVVRGDATTADLGGPYEGAIATLALSVMPDIEACVRNISESLEPGGRLVVFDLQPFPSGLRRVFNPLLRWFLRWYANWNSTESVRDSLAMVFDEVTVEDTYMGGFAYTAIARKMA